jgi:hypothetical protein
LDIYSSFLFFHCFLTLISCSSFPRYIHRELVVKNVLPHSALPAFIFDWVDVDSNLCVYTAMQVAKFPHVHLEGGGWYLDCSRGFVPEEEESLYTTLVSFAPEVIELEEEPEEDMPAPQSIEKDVAPVKAKGKGRKLVPLASSQVSTRSFTKASVQRTVAPATTVVGSPSAAPSAPHPNPAPVPSHSGATIPSVPRKRKAVAPDTSATSSERSSSLSLIENVDMGELIEDLMKTKVPPPSYRRIQDFLTKVCLSFCFFSFFVILTFVLFLDFLFNLFLSGGSGPYSSEHQAQGAYGH